MCFRFTIAVKSTVIFDVKTEIVQLFFAILTINLTLIQPIRPLFCI